jgi:large subunit ribosomal protein L13
LTLSINLSIYAQINMTNFIKKNEIKNNWLIINADNAIVGRLAAFISKILRGKNKSQYTPNMDNGDFVIVTNIEKIKFSGKKFDNKKYYRHTGYPGGIKTSSPSTFFKTKPEEVLKLAVKRMLPSGPLAKKQLSKLKIYKGSTHPHETQNPKIVEFNKLNRKNLLSLN